MIPTTTTSYTYETRNAYVEENFIFEMNEETFKLKCTIEKHENGKLIEQREVEDKWLMMHEKSLLLFLVSYEIPFKMNIWKD